MIRCKFFPSPSPQSAGKQTNKQPARVSSPEWRHLSCLALILDQPGGQILKRTACLRGSNRIISRRQSIYMLTRADGSGCRRLGFSISGARLPPVGPLSWVWVPLGRRRRRRRRWPRQVCNQSVRLKLACVSCKRGPFCAMIASNTLECLSSLFTRLQSNCTDLITSARTYRENADRL